LRCAPARHRASVRTPIEAERIADAEDGGRRVVVEADADVEIDPLGGALFPGVMVEIKALACELHDMGTSRRRPDQNGNDRWLGKRSPLNSRIRQLTSQPETIPSSSIRDGTSGVRPT
jgi:hypothetical protein